MRTLVSLVLRWRVGCLHAFCQIGLCRLGVPIVRNKLKKTNSSLTLNLNFIFWSFDISPMPKQIYSDVDVLSFPLKYIGLIWHKTNNLTYSYVKIKWGSYSFQTSSEISMGHKAVFLKELRRSSIEHEMRSTFFHDFPEKREIIFKIETKVSTTFSPCCLSPSYWVWLSVSQIPAGGEKCAQPLHRWTQLNICL